METLENLHKKLFNVTKKYQKALKEDTYYNIFEILGIQDKEIRHSKMIADLLNPQGRHGLGIILLEQFLETIGFKFDSNTMQLLDKTKIETERVTDLGIIDIALCHPDFYIVIENKIYAGDQNEQLSRYSKTTYNDKNPCKIVYLTLRGHAPSDQSIVDVAKEKIVTMSYLKTCNCQKSIMDILESDSLKILIGQKENLKSIIEQYKNTLNNLILGTHMKIEIEDENIAVYQELSETLATELNNFRQNLLQKFLNSLLNSLAQGEKKWEPSNVLLENIVLKDERYIFTECQEYSIGIGIDTQGLYIGYYKPKPDYDNSQVSTIMEQYGNFDRGRYEYIENSVGHGKKITDITTYMNEINAKGYEQLVQKIEAKANRKAQIIG